LRLRVLAKAVVREAHIVEQPRAVLAAGQRLVVVRESGFVVTAPECRVRPVERCLRGNGIGSRQ
jgi:hypothetical protein